MKKSTSFFAVLLFAVSFSVSAQHHSSKGKVFYLAYMENLGLSYNGAPLFAVVITSDVNTSGTISMPATGWSVPFSVTADVPYSYTIANAGPVLYGEGDEAYTNFGIKITANDSVSVYAFHDRLNYSEATLVLPISELSSNEFSVIAKNDDGGSAPYPGAAEMVVVATHNYTQVEITPSAVTESFRPAGVPFVVVLNDGQTFQLKSTNGLNGTKVRSLTPGRKIAVFSGADHAHITCGNSESHVYDEDFQVGMWGTDFVLIPFKGQGGDRFRVLAHDDSTQVDFIGSNTRSLDQGAWYDSLIVDPVFVHASKPISIAQFGKGSNCNSSLIGDPNMIILDPLTFENHKAIFQTSMYTTYQNHLNIAVSSIDVVSMLLDGNNIASSFNVLQGNTNYSYAELDISPGNHILEGNSFNAFAYGFLNQDAYTFHLGYDYAPGDVEAEDTTTGVGSINSPDNFSVTIYPNPSSEYVDIMVNGDNCHCGYDMNVYDVLGRMAANIHSDDATIRVTDKTWSNGTYIFDVSNKHYFRYVGKFEKYK